MLRIVDSLIVGTATLTGQVVTFLGLALVLGVVGDLVAGDGGARVGIWAALAIVFLIAGCARSIGD